MSSHHATDEDLGLMLSHACADLQRRLLAGESCYAEDYFAVFPLLASDVERALSLICAEWSVRQQMGQSWRPEAWFTRFPQWQEPLRQIFREKGFPHASAQPTTPEWHTPISDQRAPVPTGQEQPYHHLQILEPIGHGGMGVVYCAWDGVLKRHVAVKMIRSGLLTGADIERFRREARAAAQLQHPHIVPIYGMGLYQGQHCFTMPLLSGGNLAQHRDQLRRDPRRVVALLAIIARAIQAAHDKGIIHRDLKLENILLDERGEPLVADFGLAKFLNVDVELTQSGALVGTPAYMAPEQISKRRGSLSPATDIWALGVILYDLLAGQRPFFSLEWDDLSQQILNGHPPRPRQLQPTLDSSLEEIVLKCLAKEPQQRYATATALADDLQAWLQGKRLSWGQRWRRWLAGRSSRLRSTAAILLLTGILAASRFSLEIPPIREEYVSPGEVSQPVLTLIGSTGSPENPVWVLGEAFADKPPKPDKGTFTVSSSNLSALELCARPPWSSYRLEGKVRHDEVVRVGKVGFYFCHSAHDGNNDKKVHHCFCRLLFADWGTVKGKLDLDVHYQTKGETRSRDVQHYSFTEKSREKPGEWHLLAVEVTPEQIRAYWEDECIAKIARSTLEQTARRILQDIPGLRPQFSPQAGLGLFVECGKASFQNVTIKPLKSR